MVSFSAPFSPALGSHATVTSFVFHSLMSGKIPFRSNMMTKYGNSEPLAINFKGGIENRA
jgi:hypothetical protein